MHASDDPSLAAWLALGLLAAVVEGDRLLLRQRRADAQTAANRSSLLESPVVTSLSATWLFVLAAIGPELREVLWWLLAAIYGLLVVSVSWGPVVVIVFSQHRRELRDGLRSLDREHRKPAYLVLALMIASVAITALGTVLLGVLTGDVRFALATSFTAAFVVGSTARWLVRRHYMSSDVETARTS